MTEVQPGLSQVDKAKRMMEYRKKYIPWIDSLLRGDESSMELEDAEVEGVLDFAKKAFGDIPIQSVSRETVRECLVRDDEGFRFMWSLYKNYLEMLLTGGEVASDFLKNLQTKMKETLGIDQISILVPARREQ